MHRGRFLGGEAGQAVVHQAAARPLTWQMEECVEDMEARNVYLSG